jgi:hypothetical protein
MAAAWTPEPEHVITEVYLNADNSQCALVLNEGESDILLFKAEEEGAPTSVVAVEGDFRRVWP